MKRTEKLKKKALAIVVWTWLSETGKNKIDFIDEHPEGENLALCWSWCPLCDIFIELACEGCPLDSCTDDDDSLYKKWTWSSDDEKRKKYAAMILEKIKEWRI